MAEHKRRIYQVSQHSSDLDQTIVFYTEILRGRFIARFDPPGIAFIDFDGVRVIFSSNDEENGATLYYQVDDIEAATEEVRSKGVTIDSEPHMIYKDDKGEFGPAGNEEWMSFFKDPDGNVVGFVEQRVV